MRRLFIELYLDEDVHVLVSELVTAYGFSSTTARDENMLGCSDEEQLAYAVDRERTILTHNRVHFERLNEAYFQAGKTHHGIIISVQRSPYEIARRVARIMNKVTAAEMENQIRYI